MLQWAVVFLVIGLIAAMLGLTTLAGTAIAVAKFLAVSFLVLFVVFFLTGLWLIGTAKTPIRKGRHRGP
jgi:uncharacterized membrane protein YtjA (UPF0391 family)